MSNANKETPNGTFSQAVTELAALLLPRAKDLSLSQIYLEAQKYLRKTGTKNPKVAMVRSLSEAVYDRLDEDYE